MTSAGLESGVKYLATENHYELRDTSSGAVVELSNALAGSVSASLYPLLESTTKRYFEGGAGEKSTTQSFGYDAYGNVIRYHDSGDEADSDDGVDALITYSAELDGCGDTQSYIVGKPLTITVMGDGQEMRYRAGEIACSTGDMTTLRQRIGDGQEAETTLVYEANGNLKSVTGPANLHGERYSLEYAYDPSAWITGSSLAFCLPLVSR